MAENISPFQGMSDMVQQTAEQTRKAMENGIELFQKSITASPWLASSNVNKKMQKYLRQNIDAASEFSKKLTQAKDASEFLQVQSELSTLKCANTHGTYLICRLFNPFEGTTINATIDEVSGVRADSASASLKVKCGLMAPGALSGVDFADFERCPIMMRRSIKHDHTRDLEPWLKSLSILKEATDLMVTN